MGNKWIQKIKQQIYSIQVKIFAACSLVAILSIIIVTYSTYTNSSNTIEKNAINYFYESILYADDNLKVMLEDIERISTVVAVNRENIIDIINSPNIPVSYEWVQEKKKIEDFLQSLIAYKPYISRIAVVGLNGKNFRVGGAFFSSTMQEQPWAREIIETNRRHLLFNIEDKQNVSVGRPIYFEHKPIGFVIVDFNPDTIKKVYDIKPLSQSYIFSVSASGSFIYSSSDTIKQSNINDTEFKEIFQNISKSEKSRIYNIEGKKFLTVAYTSEYTGLTTIGIISYEQLLRDSIIIRNQLIKNLLVVFLIVLLISVLASNRIAKNLKKLRNTMKLVRNGDLTAQPSISGRDEVGQLSEGFVSMMQKIHVLMENIKKQEQQKREAEMKALQAQIGPHFIYNTLNTIKYLAKLQSISNIEEITGALIELLRSVLGNTEETIRIKDELEYVKSYVLIQKYKFLDRLTVTFDIEEGLEECMTLKLILQPVVENALIHGIALASHGAVLIKALREDGNIKFLVTDNGVGMTQEQIEKALSDEFAEGGNRFSRIGLKNVDGRIKLFFGDKYGIKIRSSPGIYTTLEIIIPEIIEEAAV